MKRVIGINFSKFYEEVGKRYVEGYATTEAIDSYGEIVDLEATKEALEEYGKWRNVRYMHQAHAVGVAEDLTVDHKGLYVKAEVVDDDIWTKVVKKVLKAFSIGLDYDFLEDRVWDELKKAWRIIRYDLIEISLVDRPANTECVFAKSEPPNLKVKIFERAEPERKGNIRLGLEYLTRGLAGLIKGKGSVVYGEVVIDYEGEVAIREIRERLWTCISALEKVIENIFESEENDKPSLIADAMAAFHEDVNELLAEFPGKAAGASTQEANDMNEEETCKLVTEEVGKAKAEIVAELGGKLDEIKAALPAKEPEEPTEPEAKAEPPAEEPTGTEPEPKPGPAPEEPAEEPNLDEKVANIEKRLKGVEAGKSRAAPGQDDPPEEKKEKWSGVLDSAFLSLPRQ